MLRVGLVGELQVGKSTLINCLLEGFYASIGNRVATTSRCTEYRYGTTNQIVRKNDNQVVSLDSFLMQSVDNDSDSDFIFELDCDILKYITIVDTPGVNANDSDTSTTLRALSNIDLAIVIVTNDGVSQNIIHFISHLQQIGLPYVLVMNCHPQGEFETWCPRSEFNTNIADEFISRLKSQDIEAFHLGKFPILLINAKWYLASLMGIDYLEEKKKDRHLRLLRNYLHEAPNFNINEESNVGALISFLCCSFNHYPFELYRKLENSLESFDNILMLGSSYKREVKKNFEKELCSLDKAILDLNKTLSQIKANEEKLPHLPGFSIREWQIYLLSMVDREALNEQRESISYDLSIYKLERKHIANALAQIYFDEQDKEDVTLSELISGLLSGGHRVVTSINPHELWSGNSVSESK